MDNGLVTSISCKDITFGIFKRKKPTIKTFQNYINKEMNGYKIEIYDVIL